MNIGNMFVRLSADTSGLKTGAVTAEQSLSRIGQAGERLNRVMIGVGTALAAAFTVRKVVAFGAAAVRAAAEADVVWNRLGGTLATAGVQFNSVRGDIERAASALEDITTIDDEGFAASLQTLVRITGDYSRSLAEVGTVADVAAGAQIDLDTAAQLVGKAMIGNTATLSRYGIVVEEGADAMELLRDRFRGMAANEANTLNGKLIQLSNAWDNLKEAIGEALTNAVDGQSILDTLTDKVQAATGWIESHNDVLRVWADLLGEILTKGAKVIEFLGRQSQLAADTPWWMEPFAFRRNSDFGSGTGTLPAARAIGPNTNRIPGITVTVPGRSPEEVAAGAAVAAEARERAADALASQMEIAARSLTWIESFVDSTRAAQRALDNAKMEDFAQATKDLKASMVEAAEHLHDAKIDAVFGDLKAGKRDVEAAANPAAGQGIGSQLGGLVSQITGLSVAMGPLAVAALALKPVFDGLREALGPIFAALAEPLKEIGRIIGSLLVPVLQVFEEPLRIISQLFGILAEPLRVFSELMAALSFPLQFLSSLLEVVGKAFSYIVTAIGTVVKGLGDFVDSLVPDRISKVGKGLAKQGQSLIDSAKAYREGDRVFGQMVAAAKEFTDTLTTNLPQGFRVLDLQLAQFASSTAVASRAPSGLSASQGVYVEDNRVATVQIIESATGDGTFRRRVVEIMRETFREDGLTYYGDQFALSPTGGG